MSTHAAIRPALSAISVIVSRPTSGRPSSAADAPNPVMYTAANPASSTRRAARGPNAPGATIVWPESSSARSRAGPPGRRVSRPVTGPAPVAPAHVTARYEASRHLQHRVGGKPAVREPDPAVVGPLPQHREVLRPPAASRRDDPTAGTVGHRLRRQPAPHTLRPSQGRYLSLAASCTGTGAWSGGRSWLAPPRMSGAWPNQLGNDCGRQARPALLQVSRHLGTRHAGQADRDPLSRATAPAADRPAPRGTHQGTPPGRCWPTAVMREGGQRARWPPSGRSCLG